MENKNKETQDIANNQSVSSTIGFVCKKAEKLVTAVYMLSNFFPDKEPLRLDVRQLGLDLLSANSNVFYEKNSNIENHLTESVGIIDELIVRFEIAHVSNLISRMNFTVLKNELCLLKDIIETLRKSDRGQSILITSDFFLQEKLLEEGDNDRLPAASAKVAQAGQPTIDNPQKIPTINNQASTKLVSQRSDLDVPVLRSYLKPTSPTQGLTLRLPKVRPLPTRSLPKSTESREAIETRSSTHSVASKRKEGRSETILKILSKKDNLTVKDIAHVISDCSEKTIQRELLALVEKNVLKKVGERRWSRYSLKQLQ